MSLEPTFGTTIEAARSGADWAWAALYRDYTPNLRRYLKARGAHDPDDLVGEVFVQVVRKLPEFRGGESQFKAWLYAIARNRLVDDARYRRRRATEPLPLDRLALSPGGQVGNIDASTELSQHLRDVLGHLTPEQRDVLFLRVLAGLSLEETAQVLDKTTGSVKRLQARGLKSLRQKISAGVVSF